MAVVIRLKRTGAKKDTAFRIVVADSRRARDGRFIEQLGFYDPTPKVAQYKVDAERATYWLGVGALPSDQVRSLLRQAGVAIPAPQKKAAKKAKPASGTKRATRKTVASREVARRTRKREDRLGRKAATARRTARAAAKPAAAAEATA
jgi:small subunit ribosomal protein S16